MIRVLGPAERNTVTPEVRAQVAEGYGFDEPVLAQHLLTSELCVGLVRVPSAQC
ncbi:hypothetical protein GCM10010145_60280 [Streptomyces ruber]|uniref:Uncharacterized protein n=2 Tax=Streptomyces TaxID=1883 RepID=A0A918EYI4_9ACTN|nr:hypothetical protein [Streptomyces ruber]GGQ82441.1 hypothetical protein GCM10010145_60280 [Streptomyces ruber]